MSQHIDPERLKQLHQKMQLYRFLQEREEYEESLFQFLQGSWPAIDSASFLSGWAIQALCEHLEAVTEGQIKRLLINFPPRCAKTSITSICWPAWTWARSERSFYSGPAVKFLTASYNASLSLTNANKIRRLIDSPFYQRYWADRFSMREDQNAKAAFDNTAGGGVKATSVGGSLLGIGGDIIICLPYEERVSTSEGWIPIGEVVENKLALQVLGFDHTNNCVTFQAVEAYEKNPGKALLEVDWGIGTLRCTEDHPIYVEGKGYILAAAVSPGDSVFSCVVGQTSTVTRQVVRAIRDAGTAEATYNLRVGPHHNYFAEGLLVHNCDDPHNTETDKVVETDADRMKVASFWRELSGTRLNSPKESAIVVVMQRLHQGDLSGIILDEDEGEWTHLMLPMRHDPARHCVTVQLPAYDDEQPWEDPRDPDGEELMWPERFGEVEVARSEKALGPYMASGRLQQSPVPKGGGIIQRDWWQLWDQSQAQQYGLEWTGARKEFPQFELVVGSLDTSTGEKEENDYNAFTVWGIWLDKAKNRRAMLMYAWKKRLKLNGKLLTPFPGEARVTFEQRQREEWGLVEWVADTAKRYKVRRLIIENRTRGRDVSNEIQRLYMRENWGVELLEPVGDKVSRTHSVVPLFTDGTIWAPDTRWSDMVISESEIFPKGEHDDLHDTVTQFANWARTNGLLLRTDEMSAAVEEENAYKPPVRSISEHYGV